MQEHGNQVIFSYNLTCTDEQQYQFRSSNTQSTRPSTAQTSTPSTRTSTTQSTRQQPPRAQNPTPTTPLIPKQPEGAKPEPKEDISVTNLENEKCCVCLDGPKNTIVLPCGHIGFCYKCAQELYNRSAQCPICRSPIQSVHKAYKV